MSTIKGCDRWIQFSKLKEKAIVRYVNAKAVYLHRCRFISILLLRRFFIEIYSKIKARMTKLKRKYKIIRTFNFAVLRWKSKFTKHYGMRTFDRRIQNYLRNALVTIFKCRHEFFEAEAKEILLSFIRKRVTIIIIQN